MKQEDKIKALEERIKKLEKEVFGPSKRKSKSSSKYKGLVGGINLLIDNGFFNKPKLVTEVKDELNREGYFHSIQSIDTILRRDLVKRKRTLNRVKEDGVWQYAIRK
ncbi:MAG: hypothetical protein GWN01_11990 [Nitrosopumilaceae archaeon]|nr:hypothetical protein [Nitrosopumilaceae archaeon]NIU01597.1 hypothetical protein [Nitrosopumilaceae archaeon]NIU88016.1 hypothetical protein [Nitrosopumilaceae archaeon]NIV66283.1 hypothetical protein [Nitrosopumilaceae archaeon]NIX62199.1 hypothetical protein [Nitrosopumilaceae archaeon]